MLPDTLGSEKRQFIEDLYHKFLHEVEQMWFEIGVLLGIPFNMLEGINTNHNTSMDKLIEVIDVSNTEIVVYTALKLAV